MSCINWIRARKDVIEIVCAVVTTIAVVAGASSIWFAYQTLKENKKATNAQTLFSVQRFGFEFAKEIFADEDFVSYLDGGSEALGDKELNAVRRKFGLMMMAYGIIFFQAEHDYLSDRERDLFEEDLCGSMASVGANDYFANKSLCESKFDEQFKRLIASCRKEKYCDQTS